MEKRKSLDIVGMYINMVNRDYKRFLPLKEMTKIIQENYDRSITLNDILKYRETELYWDYYQRQMEEDKYDEENEFNKMNES